MIRTHFRYFFVLSLITIILIVNNTALSKTLDLSSFSKQTQNRLFDKIPNLNTPNWKMHDLDLLIESLIINEGYDAVHIVESKNQEYRVIVGKVKRISSLKFSGSKEFSENILRSETGLTENLAFDPNMLIEAAEKIRQMYSEKGYPSAIVDIITESPSPTEVNVKVDIKEGIQSKIHKIQFVTSNSDLKNRLERLSKSYINSPYTQSNLVELKTLLKSNLSKLKYWRTDIEEAVINMSFDESQADLIFQIKNSDQYFFETDGNFKLVYSEIFNGLNLDSYSSSNPNIAGELSTKTRNLYLSQGFARAEVEGIEVEGSKPFTKRIILKISEGPKVKIEKYQLIGSFSENEKLYIDFLKEHASDQIQSGYYVKDDLDVALKNLITDRWNLGFLQAKVSSTRTIYNSERNRISVIIQFDEGPLTLVDKIQFDGIQSISEHELLKVVTLKEGQPLRLSQLESDVSAIKDYYYNNGFLEMNLRNEKTGDLVKYKDENTKGSLVFNIQEGPQVKVASILIDGNTLTKDYVILKELEFKVGDILTPAKIEESTSRLQRLGFFSTVEIKTLEEKTNISERTVVVRVSDRDPGLFNLGLGFNNERGFSVRGYMGVAYRNIQGTGRGGSIRVDGNYNVDKIKFLENKVTLGYVEPYLFDSRTRGRLNIVRSTSIKDFDARQASEVNQTTWSLEQDIDSHTSAVWDVLSIATIRDFYIDENGEDSSLDIGSTAFTVDFDYRNHPFTPTKGTFTRVNLEYGSPSLKSTNTIEYVRSYGSFTHYLEVFKKLSWIWANSIRAGYLQNLSGKSDGAVPYDKKGFILGGQSSIRGFTPDEAFPNKYDFGSVDNFYLKKSATMTLFKSELRFPVLRTWNIGGAVFYDGGIVKLSCTDSDSTCLSAQSRWRDTVGIALRYATPVGAVSFEYGWKIKPNGNRNEDPSAFHFSIGTF